MEIDYLIEYEGESTNLDFKATQYRKENYFELLKDIIAMANAITDGEKLIITGVKKKLDGTFVIVPIAEGEFVDSATYQQLVLDNIEPEIHIDYTPHLYEGQLVGVLTIPPCSNKPYMMKKAFGSEKQSRKAGESFIRKGTTTLPLMRKDIDQIFERKKYEDAFTHQISFYFSGTQTSKVLELEPAESIKLYSQIEADKIQEIINQKEKAIQDRLKAEEEYRNSIAKNGFVPALNRLLKTHESTPYSFRYSPLGGVPQVPYKDRPLKTLYEDLTKVSETFKEEDYYVLYNKQARKVNITVLNEGSKYLEDATLKIELPVIRGYVIAEQLFRRPIEDIRLTDTYYDGNNADYPKYKIENGVYTFIQSLGNLKHLQPQLIFKEPLRITIGRSLAGSAIEVKLTLFGKNLPSPIKDTLILKITQGYE